MRAWRCFEDCNHVCFSSLVPPSLQAADAKEAEMMERLRKAEEEARLARERAEENARAAEEVWLRGVAFAQ